MSKHLKFDCFLLLIIIVVQSGCTNTLTWSGKTVWKHSPVVRLREGYYYILHAAKANAAESKQSWYHLSWFNAAYLGLRQLPGPIWRVYYPDRRYQPNAFMMQTITAGEQYEKWLAMNAQTKNVFLQAQTTHPYQPPHQQEQEQQKLGQNRTQLTASPSLSSLRPGVRFMAFSHGENLTHGLFRICLASNPQRCLGATTDKSVRILRQSSSYLSQAWKFIPSDSVADPRQLTTTYRSGNYWHRAVQDENAYYPGGYQPEAPVSHVLEDILDDSDSESDLE